jgi:hypothetical protein
MKPSMLFVAAAVVSQGHAQVLESSAVWDTGPTASRHRYALYSVTDSPFTWEQAHAYAESLGGHLATVGSAEENEFIYGALGIGSNDGVWHVDGFGSHIGPWLGGHQPGGSPEPMGGWRWVTGEAWGFTLWAPNEPNNFGGGEDRVHFFGNPQRTSRWNDIGHGVPIEGFVVEFGPCNEADLATPFGLLDLSDVTTFIAAFVAEDPIADLNGDGLFDLSDVNRFVGAFVAGCP